MFIHKTTCLFMYKMETIDNINSSNIDKLGGELIELINEYGRVKKSKESQELYNKYREDKKLIFKALKKDEIKKEAFKILVEILPLEQEFIQDKPHFPDENYGELFKAILDCKDPSVFLEILNEYTMYEDMNLNIWKGVEIASKQKLDPLKVKNILTSISLFKTPNPKEEKPKNYFCRTKIGVLNPKKINECARKIWERIMIVDLPLRTRQLLLITLLEKIMPNMDKPVFLTDYFMNSLELGGAITLLSLQGIFELIQKHNINYPNIYGKLYDMFKPEIFETTYKARFYYLSDLFLSSLHLPEALVAGFAKRLARLALVAPPPDIIILMAFITNLILRHRGLEKLISNMKTIHMDSDPFIEDEKDPSKSQALESSLWEVLLIQNHLLPSVSHSAMFINNPLPEMEVDLSSLLEVKIDEMFEKEMKKKLAKDPPLVYEKPTVKFLSIPNNQQGFTNWNFCI